MAGEAVNFQKGFSVHRLGLSASGVAVLAGLDPMKLMTWRAARANPDVDTPVAFVGDSTYAGYITGGGTAQFPNSMPQQFAKKLNARGINADTDIRFGCGSSSFSDLAASDGRIAYTGSVTQGGLLTAGGNAINVPLSGTLTFTPEQNVNTYDVWTYAGATGRTFRLTAGTGTPVTVSQTVAGVLTKTTVTADALGIKPLLLDNVTGGTIVVVGIRGYNSGRKAITVFNWGISGARSDQLIDNTDLVGGRRAVYAAIAPKLVFIEGGVINDWRQSIAVATTKANLTTLVGLFKPTASVILTTPNFDNGVAGATAAQESYVTAVREVAAEQAVNIIDLRASHGSFVIGSAAGFYSDTVHGSKIGYGDQAETLISALFGG